MGFLVYLQHDSCTPNRSETWQLPQSTEDQVRYQDAGQFWRFQNQRAKFLHRCKSEF